MPVGIVDTPIAVDITIRLHTIRTVTIAAVAEVRRAKAEFFSWNKYSRRNPNLHRYNYLRLRQNLQNMHNNQHSLDPERIPVGIFKIITIPIITMNATIRLYETLISIHLNIRRENNYRYTIKVYL